MTNNRFEFLGRVWLYPGMAGWRFISLPIERSGEIKGRDILMRRGFGAVKVAITIGKTSWRTSIFPDSGLMHFAAASPGGVLGLFAEVDVSPHPQQWGPRGAHADYITADKSVAELDDEAIFAKLAPLLS